jgi:hypothetical protein
MVSPHHHTSRTAHPPTYTHTKHVFFKQSTQSIISTPHHAHQLTTPQPDQPPSPCWFTTPLYYLTLSTPTLSLPQPLTSTLETHTPDPITNHTFSHHITSHHITHTTLILHTARPPPPYYTPTSTTHQPPTHAHTCIITSHVLSPSHVLQRRQAWRMTQSSADRCTSLTTKAVPPQTATSTHTYAATANHQRTHSLHLSRAIRDLLQP